MKIAMLSYNSFLPTKGTGWVKNTLFVIQSENASGWGAQQIGFGTRTRTALRERRNEGIGQVRDIVMSHWDKLAGLLPELDKVVIYVGDSGSEHTIRYAAKHGLPADKAMFVLCDCNERNKRHIIKENGFGEAPVVMCECGGRRTMANIAAQFLKTGELPN